MWRLIPFWIVSQQQGHSEISARVKGPLVTVGTEGTSQRLLSTKLNRKTRGALAYIKELGSRNTHQLETREETTASSRQQVEVNVTLTSRSTKQVGVQRQIHSDV